MMRVLVGEIFPPCVSGWEKSIGREYLSFL